jgi:KDO2-lipid IV(A) lauroyltransferase
MPSPAGRELLAALGAIGYRLPFAESRRIRDNLMRALGPEAAPLLARQVFPAIGRNLADTITYGKPGNRLGLEWKGTQNLAEAAARKKGVIVLGAHWGAFEIIPRALARSGFPLTVVAARLYEPRMDAWVARLRAEPGVDYIRPEGAFRRLKRVLESGGTIGLMVDLFFPRLAADPVSVTFFGAPYAADALPYRLAEYTNAVLVPVFIHRTGKGSHRIQVMPAIAPPAAGAQEYFQQLETLVRAHPAEWAWMHDIRNNEKQ